MNKEQKLAFAQFIITTICALGWLALAAIYLSDPERALGLKILGGFVGLGWCVLAVIRFIQWNKIKQK